MKTVKELLEELSREVNQLTDLRKKYKVNVKGQRVEGIKIINAFDEDMRDFLSSYFRGVAKSHWLTNECFILFNMNGRKREMVLYAAKFKRSKVDLLTFPFPEELEQPWRMTLRTHNGKRKLTAPSTSSPNKKILCQALTQPLFPLIRPLIPLIRPLIPNALKLNRIIPSFDGIMISKDPAIMVGPWT
jgi:hypothetical protein